MAEVVLKVADKGAESKAGAGAKVCSESSPPISRAPLLTVPQALPIVPSAGKFVGVVLKSNPNVPLEAFVAVFPL